MTLIKRLAITILFILTLTVCLALPATAIHDAELWESYTTGDDAAFEMYGNIWGAQTFTVGAESHSVTSVRLLLYREGNPGTVTVSIKATSGGDPSGTDLTSGTLDGDLFTDAAAGVWYEFDLTEYCLCDGTMFAIVVRCEGGDAANSVHWRSDASAGAEADGQEETSVNAGATWTGDADDDFLFEVWGVGLLDVVSAMVFRDYLEDNDMLFVLEYYNVYVPYYPNDDPARYFDVRLTSADGATLLASGVCRAWGNKPASIYLSADQAAGLTPGSLYRLYIFGVMGGNPNDYYQLAAADWRGEDLTYLDNYVLTMAHAMADYYDTSFTTYTGTTEVLNDEGAIIFGIGIPALQIVRPDLFVATAQIPEYQPKEWTDAFVGATTWDVMVGTDVTTLFTTGGDMFGLTGKDFGAYLILLAYVVLAASATYVKTDPSVIIGLALPLIALGGWLRLIDIVILAAVGAVALFLFIYSFFWSRT